MATNEEKGKEKASFLAKIFLKSKKARALVAGALTVILNDKLGLNIPPDAMLYLVGLLGVYITAVGVTDHGKEAEMVRLEAAIDELDNPPAE